MQASLFIVLLNVLFCATAIAEDTDPIGDELSKAILDHRIATSKAKLILMNAIDAKIRTTAATGDLDAVQKVVAEKKAFEADSSRLPSSADLAPAVKSYKDSIEPADAVLDAS